MNPCPCPDAVAAPDYVESGPAGAEDGIAALPEAVPDPGIQAAQLAGDAGSPKETSIPVL
jgi:hypothetical protein